jgi:hypothetical protein
VSELVSVEQILEQIRQAHPQAPEIFGAAVAGLTGSLVVAFWQEKIKTLLDSARWTELAANPQRFNAELDAVLKEIRGFMKAVYGIPGYHPAKQAKRDAEIWRTKQQHPAWTLAQIGRQFHLSAPAVKSVLNRHEARERKRAESFKRFMALIEELLQRMMQQPATAVTDLTEVPTSSVTKSS